MINSIPASCPLTFSQQGVYFECIENPQTVKYDIPLLCRLPDGTDAKRFCEAVKTAVKCHPALLCVIGTCGGVPSMIYKGGDVSVTEKSVDDINAEISSIIRPFDLENGPLYKFELLHAPDGLYFLLNIHHTVFDGSSIGYLFRDIADAYDGKECIGEEKTIFDVSAQEAAPDEEKKRIYREFFEKKFDGANDDSRIISDLLADENVPSGQGVVRVFTAGSFSSDEVERFLKKHGLTANSLFLGAFGYSLAKFNGTCDAVCATAHTGRNDRALAGAVGMFVRTLPLRCSFDENDAPAKYLKAVSDDYYFEKKNDCVPFGELAAKYGLGTEMYFVYHDRLLDKVPMSGGYIDVTLLDAGEMVSDIDMMVMRRENDFEIAVHFERSVYSEELVRGFTEFYINAVRGMMDCERLRDITLVTAETRRKLDSFNATETDYDRNTTVVRLFRQQAAKTPGNICLVCRDKRFTYREIDEITDALAAKLRKCGVEREKVVGVLIHRNEYMLICALGILKAGGAYLPLDPTYPPERLNLLMSDSGAMMLIHSPDLNGIISEELAKTRMTTDEILSLPPCDIELPEPQPEDLFVMLYTSGSTGVPKGVMFQHSNTLVLAEWVKKYYSMDENSRCTSYASYGFDAHTFDFYPAVISGAQLHIIYEDIRLDFPALREYFNENGITHSVMTTQVGRQFALLGGLKTLRCLSVGGEKLTPFDVPDGFDFYNLYGPTEASVATSAFKLDKKYKDVPIGKPLDNLKLYVVDKFGRLLPPNAVGELWVSGEHVTRGYLNRPEKTAEAYGDNPFEDTEEYSRIYRTGDIVRLLSDGNLQFVGRRDGQVKVRGFRVELTEIEEVIRRFPGIKDATVAAFDDPAGGKYVAAYVVSDVNISVEELGDFIRSEKPPYMVPAVTMQIDKIPLNQNHKVNKKALPVPERKIEETVPPVTETQKKLYDIIREIVGHDSFGITTDIYDAGLTSIGAIRLNVALSDSFKVPVKIADIKGNSTIERLERFILAAAPSQEYAVQDDYPITQTQSGIFVECISAPDTTVYNIPILLRLGDNVDTARLAEAVRKTIDAHPYLKTTLFTDSSGNIRARRNDEKEISIEVEKCTVLPGREQLVRPFAMLGGELCRVRIFETSNGNYLFMDLHHIISDGTSEAVLLSDIDRAYNGEELQKESFTGFEAALEEENMRKSEAYEKAKEYWKNLLSGCETSCLPRKLAEDPQGGAGFRRVLGRLEAEKVKAFCEENQLTVNAFFNGVFSLVLSRFIGKISISYATIYNGRSDSRLARAVTMLVKTIPVAVDIDENAAVTDHIKAIQTQLLDSMSRDVCSFAELSAAYGVNSDIIFAYQGEDFTFDSLCGEQAQMISFPPETAKAPIALNVYLVDGRFEYAAEYEKDSFCEPLLESLIDAIMAAAEGFIGGGALKDISLCCEKAEKIYAAMNDSTTPIERLLVPELISLRAKETPEKTAVIAAGEKLSFGELDRLSNLAANRLAGLGLKQESIVGLVLERTKEVFITGLAIMKAGGAFLPMIPSYPDERIEYCLTNAESPFVITTGAIKRSKKELFAGGKPYKTLTVEELLLPGDDSAPDISVSPEQLAYCIYTSGSTGKPKGVMIEHRNFTNFVQTDILKLNYYTDKKYDGTCLATSSISFDMSLYETYMPLCAGKTVCMATEDEFHNPLLLRDLMINNNVQAMTCTPSFMNNMLAMPGFDNALKGLVSLVVGAEAFPPALYDALRSAAPGLQIVNGYGPTETSVCCSTKELDGVSPVTIGRPTGNVKFFVADKLGHVQPPYAVGELIICGDGVGRGYVKLPEKSAASFFTFRSLPAYHSGDLVFLTGGGEIAFGGRMDNQVKLRGFRVELDEIEKVMCLFGSVRQSKVLVRNNGTEDYLAGFFTAEETVDIDALTAHMKAHLTYYMVPAALMQLEQMPLTPNGKIDKNAFPEVKQTARKAGSGRKAKQSLEQRLCEIFSSVLGIEEVFADDNFFELGGTSLSAAKVTMLLMSDGIEVMYGDIFDNPTPEELAVFIQGRGASEKAPEKKQEKENTAREALKYNLVRYAGEVERKPLGDVLLTGAVGFLGIHILKELLDTETGHIYCLCRRGKHETAEIRLKTMLVYYFSKGFEEELKDRITVIEADITDDSLGDALRDVEFDTLINCAACVKHFSDSDILERINVHGVENLIDICKKRDKKLIQISTVSVPGVHTQETYEKQIRMHENELFVIDDWDNKYGISKYHAEERMLDAIESGLRGKIIRVGNLMGRHSDGEFQVNMETNMFISGIRGFATMGKYPISHMTDPMKFSPVDCTAKAVVLLSGVNDKFTAFNCDNRYGFDEMKLIDACNRCGITILPEADEKYYAEYHKKLGDDRVNSRLSGLAAYDVKDAHVVETDNLFTTNILYRIGFSWPLTDDAYLDRAIDSIMTLDYFDLDSIPED